MFIFKPFVKSLALLAFLGVLSCGEKDGDAVGATSLERRTISLIRTLQPIGYASLLAVDSHKNVFHLNVSAGTIEKIDTSGNLTTLATYGASGGNAALAIGRDDNLYVAANSRIRIVTPAGNVSDLIASLPGGNSAYPSLAVDSAGIVYYTEALGTSTTPTQKIIKVTPQGVASTFAGSGQVGHLDANGINATFYKPKYLAVDPAGNLFVAETGNFAIRKISPTGDVSTFAGSGIQKTVNGSGTGASFSFVNDHAQLAADRHGNLYVSDFGYTDTWEAYIRKISPSGVVTTYCGTPSPADLNVPGSCDSTGAWIGGGLAVASDGTIFYSRYTDLFSVSR